MEQSDILYFPTNHTDDVPGRVAPAARKRRGRRGALHPLRRETYHVAYEPERCARTHRWKYNRRFDDEHPTPALANIDDGPSKDVILSNGWARRPIPAEQLYDLLHDPNEAYNLAGEPALENVIQDMRARLDTWMRETQDPLLDCPVPAPKGAELNYPTQLSPIDPTTTVYRRQHDLNKNSQNFVPRP